MIFLSLPPKYWIGVQVSTLILMFLLLKYFVAFIYFVCEVGRHKVCLSLWEMVLSSYQVGSRDRTQILKLGGKLLHPLSHLDGPCIYLSF